MVPGVSLIIGGYHHRDEFGADRGDNYLYRFVLDPEYAFTVPGRPVQFLTGHFPTGVYLYRFGHLSSPLCVGCGVLDTREHLLMDFTRWAFHRARLREWLQSTCVPHTEEGFFPPFGIETS